MLLPTWIPLLSYTAFIQLLVGVGKAGPEADQLVRSASPRHLVGRVDYPNVVVGATPRRSTRPHKHYLSVCAKTQAQRLKIAYWDAGSYQQQQSIVHAASCCGWSCLCARSRQHAPFLDAVECISRRWISATDLETIPIRLILRFWGLQLVRPFQIFSNLKLILANQSRRTKTEQAHSTTGMDVPTCSCHQSGHGLFPTGSWATHE